VDSDVMISTLQSQGMEKKLRW